MIHGMVDRPLTFTMEELKRLPYVTRMHFLECIGNRSRPSHKTVQETHGMTSCSEWTGVPLSLLLKEAGVQAGASWIVAEGAEEVKGASSIPLGKAMDDCLVCYGQNGEPVRPQQGFPLRLIVPGFEGIYQTKYVRRIKVVDRYYMTYNDYGHIQPDPKVEALTVQLGPKSVITFPSGGQQLPGPGLYEISGLALVRWRRHSQGGSFYRRRPNLEGTPSFGLLRIEWRIPGLASTGIGTEKSVCSCRAARTNWARFNRPEPRSRNTLTCRRKMCVCQAPTIPFNRGGWPAMGVFTMRLLRFLLLLMVLAVCQIGWAQSPTYGVGKTPSAEEIRAWDIAISPTGKELPPGHGTAKEGAQFFVEKGCSGMPRGNRERRPGS